MFLQKQQTLTQLLLCEIKTGVNIIYGLGSLWPASVLHNIYLQQTLAMKARDQECHLLTDHQHYPQQTWVSAYAHEDSSVLWRGVV
jgi:hypothetical protein